MECAAAHTARSGGSSRPWAESAYLPEQPLRHLDPTAHVSGEELPSLFREIEQDCAGLEHADRRTPWKVVAATSRPSPADTLIWPAGSAIRNDLQTAQDESRATPGSSMPPLAG
jgi:hypothetical protein